MVARARMRRRRQLRLGMSCTHNFMMGRTGLGMLKCLVNKNFVKVVVFIKKNIFTTMVLRLLAQSAAYDAFFVRCTGFKHRGGNYSFNFSDFLYGH